MQIPVSFLVDVGNNPTEIIESMASLSFTVPPPGVVLYQIVETISQGLPLKIIETGCLRDTQIKSWFDDGWSTYYFARWVKDHPGSDLTTIELNPDNIKTCKNFLAEKNLSEYVSFHVADSLDALLQDWGRVDIFFLDSCDGLEHGLKEFKAALTHKPQLIIMDDLLTKGQLAVEYAEEIGIRSFPENRYTLFYTGKYFRERK